MEVKTGNLLPPPPTLDDDRVLEYVIFDDAVETGPGISIRAAPGEPLPIEALAICQSLKHDRPNELYLFYCAEGWQIDSQNIWNSSNGPAANSVDDLKSHAKELYLNIDEKWVQVGQFEPSFESTKRWWQFWK
jgi:hypothetical protein